MTDPRTCITKPDLLKDRVVLITGAGDGIGRATARAAGACGAQVILLGRTVKKLETVYDAIEHSKAPGPAIVPMDLAGAGVDDYAALAEKVQTDYGRLDGLCHIAGILGDRSPIEHYDPVTWQRVMHVNLTAGFLLTRALLPALRASPDASIVFTSSGVGKRGKAYWGAYSVSKFGTEGLMEVLADELENAGIRCNCVNPGATRTRMRAAAYPAEDPSTLKTSEEVVGPYLYLLGPDSRGVTGQSIDVQ